MTPAAIESALQAWRPATVTRPGDFAHFLASSFYRSLVGEVRPEVRAVTSIALGPLEDAAEHVSVTLPTPWSPVIVLSDRKSTRLSSSHVSESRMPSSA